MDEEETVLFIKRTPNGNVIVPIYITDAADLLARRERKPRAEAMQDILDISFYNDNDQARVLSIYIQPLGWILPLQIPLEVSDIIQSTSEVSS